MWLACALAPAPFTQTPSLFGACKRPRPADKAKISPDSGRFPHFEPHNFSLPFPPAPAHRRLAPTPYIDLGDTANMTRIHKYIYELFVIYFHMILVRSTYNFV
ncbi:hypothetical protein F5884DRAFT_750499 [Xylogone sp. PMI_703]|nr:hypothetical protein F5884DRAFT_750499 [Xylogone sp. PMI_703]